MSTNVIMPSLGFDMTEGLLARWLKNEGDPVEKGQAIAEIETEKATVEIEAAAAGILARIIVHAGETVPVGTLIGVIAEAGEEVRRAAPRPRAASSSGSRRPRPGRVPPRPGRGSRRPPSHGRWPRKPGSTCPGSRAPAPAAVWWSAMSRRRSRPVPRRRLPASPRGPLPARPCR